MLKIFRSRRKNLISNLPSKASAKGGGKTTKYFKYAVGEIVLVAIGILLALQINTWNSNRIVKQEEKAVLEKLSKDLEADYIRFTEIDSFYTEHLKYLKHKKGLIYKKDHTDDDIKELIYYGGAQILEINPRRTTFEEMINSGKIYNLTNDDLVDEIIEYYRMIDEGIYQLRQTRNEFRALFYGSDLTDYWSWKGEEYPFPYAKDFHNNQNTKAYKLLKQSAGWSTSIIDRSRSNNLIHITKNQELLSHLNNERLKHKD